VAELLDQPSRSLINEVFAVEMADIYGTTEAYCIGWECPHHCGYHLNVDTLIIEFIRNGKPARMGEPGRIVVTPIYLYAMPLIRYDLGDIGVPTELHCSCGRGLPLMQMIQGRADDFITLADGTLIPPVGTFANVFEKEEKILEYLVVQEGYDLISVKLVVREGMGSEVVERVKDGIEDLIRRQACVQVEAVDRIDRTSGAKARRILSKIPVTF
jgi:phenylacetate-CoA ligase